VELPQRQEKDFLNKIVHFAWRYSSEQNAVNHARVAVIEAAESGAIARASGANERVLLLARFGGRPGSHSLTFHAGGPKVNAVSHVKQSRANACYGCKTPGNGEVLTEGLAGQIPADGLAVHS